jgi:hypothetical protein
VSTVRSAGSPPAFVSKPKRRNVRETLYAYHGHAWEDLGVNLRKRARCHGFPPERATYRFIPCPICGQARTWAELTIEHVPQKGGQSAFGPAVLKILTCGSCNNGANDKFERLVSITASPQAASPGSAMGPCRSRRRTGWSATGQVVAAITDAQFLTDLKSAFLLAFAALGYRYALAVELEPVREAIRTGIRCGEDVAVRADFPADGRAEVVYIDWPHRTVLVKAADGTGLLLPAIGAATLPFTPQQLRSGTVAIGPAAISAFPWPEEVPTGEAQFEAIYQTGNLFHYDHCRNHY